MEIWKDVLNYEGLYQVSNLGRVKSLKRKVRHFSGERLVLERILKGGVNDKGYILVNLGKKGTKKVFAVHKLVAIAFLNHKPCGYKLVVDHIDNNKLNNKLENLQIITQQENVLKSKINFTQHFEGVPITPYTRKNIFPKKNEKTKKKRCKCCGRL